MSKTALNIVMVEDDEIGGFISEQVMKNCGYHLSFWARTGESLLDYLTEHRADVLLVDINLPSIDGFDILCQLKSRQILNNAVVVILTSSSRQLDKEKAESSGIVDLYIQKPLSGNSFKQILEVASSKVQLSS